MRSHTNTLDRRAGLGFLALILALMLSLVPLGSAFAADTTITVGSSGEVTPGSEFTVPVNIEGNTGFAAAAFQFTYDTDALELVGFNSEGGLMRNGMLEGVDASTVGYFSGSDMRDDGLLFSVVFRVKDDAPGGVYDIQIGLVEGAATNLVNSQAQTITVSFSSGVVQVAGTGSPGTDTGTTGTTTTQPVTTTPERVVAEASDGSQISLLLRLSDNTREYSLDNGVSWNRVPENGIITTLEGRRISIDGSANADYVVGELPAALVVQKPESSLFGLPQIIIGIVILLVIIIAIILIVRSRRKEARRLSANLRETSRQGSQARAQERRDTAEQATEDVARSEDIAKRMTENAASAEDTAEADDFEEEDEDDDPVITGRHFKKA